MTAVRLTARPVPRLALIAGMLCAVAACDNETSTAPASARATWQEPASYTYTLRSSEGERSLLGTFRITVRDGAVAKAVGLDDSGRHVVEDVPEAVPTIGGLLGELEQARRDDADTAEVEYAADGHPVRISLDWEEDAIDDEARYVISAYQPTDGRRVSR
ncbi:DUF6174 domain-containing protein [Streptomyces sp. DT2A-34]|uniref:DUF6174 domain-containing protein n=1 Tax=Streptomyces sp. DT2A-34 TaxID=3051182 RepID=UPI00265C26B9|nr:DUF6174 domain-containing protein [Streptomyces sp. DT2A-34]MDO0911033.1 DUF6174 domain-containing protein [Streptomyces sp. DT2A-34]